MHNLIEYNNNYSKTLGSLFQYYRDMPNDADSELFKYKLKFTCNTNTESIEDDVKTLVPFKYLTDFWRTLKVSLINCEIILNLTWPANCVIVTSTGLAKFAVKDAKL